MLRWAWAACGLAAALVGGCGAAAGDDDVRVASTVAPPASTTTASTTTFSPAPTAVSPVWSTEDALALQRRMVADRDALQRGDLRAPALASAGADTGRYGLGTTPDGLQVRVELERVTAEAVGWFEERYGAAHLAFVETTSGPAGAGG